MPEKILIYSRFPKALMVRIGQRFELMDAAGRRPNEVFSAEELSPVRAIITAGGTPLGGGMMDMMPKLGAIVCYGTGYDGVDPRHADQMVRGVVNLPNGTGRTLRVGVFARGAKAEEAKAAGADVVGAEDLVEKVQGGTIDFDRCIATPDMMPLVGRLGKVLGPRGMMPNPKIGTVTMDVATAVKGAKGGSVEFRVEKAGIVQAGIGKASFTEQKLVENVKALADAVAKAKPAGAKGTYIQRVAVSSTMGPGVKVEPGSLH